MAGDARVTAPDCASAPCLITGARSYSNRRREFHGPPEEFSDYAKLYFACATLGSLHEHRTLASAIAVPEVVRACSRSRCASATAMSFVRNKWRTKIGNAP